MPALQSISLTDRESTPVVHSFVPRDLDANGVGATVETGGVAIGESRFTAQGRRTGTKYKATFALTVPIVATQVINGVSSPAIQRTGYVKVELSVDQTSSTQERKNLIGMMASALGASALTAPKTLVEDTFVNLQGVWG